MTDGETMTLKETLAQVVAGQVLDEGAMTAAMSAILRGEAEPAWMAAFVVALRMRGEAPVEISAAAKALRSAASSVKLQAKGPLLDTCGTGGDGAGSFNISTVSAIVLASIDGVQVAKHGNRAVSSRCGSADVLEALGIRLELSPEAHQRCLDEAGITFLFAPAHHAALRHVAATRRALGLRTLFNLLGPLANPAGATHQVVGVYDPSRTEQMAAALSQLGVARGWVVHGQGGLDEVSCAGLTRVSACGGGWRPTGKGDAHGVQTFEVSPETFGLAPVSLSTLEGGDAEENAAIATRILAGEAGGPRTAVVLNAAAALLVAGLAPGPEAAASMVAQAIDEGRAAQTLARWQAASQAGMQ